MSSSIVIHSKISPFHISQRWKIRRPDFYHNTALTLTYGILAFAYWTLTNTRTGGLDIGGSATFLRYKLLAGQLANPFVAPTKQQAPKVFQSLQLVPHVTGFLYEPAHDKCREAASLAMLGRDAAFVTADAVQCWPKMKSSCFDHDQNAAAAMIQSLCLWLRPHAESAIHARQNNTLNVCCTMKIQRGVLEPCISVGH